MNWMNCDALCNALAAFWVAALVGCVCGIGKMIAEIIKERRN